MSNIWFIVLAPVALLIIIGLLGYIFWQRYLYQADLNYNDPYQRGLREGQKIGLQEGYQFDLYNAPIPRVETLYTADQLHHALGKPFAQAWEKAKKYRQTEFGYVIRAIENKEVIYITGGSGILRVKKVEGGYKVVDGAQFVQRHFIPLSELTIEKSGQANRALGIIRAVASAAFNDIKEGYIQHPDELRKPFETILTQLDHLTGGKQ